MPVVPIGKTTSVPIGQPIVNQLCATKSVLSTKDNIQAQHCGRAKENQNLHPSDTVACKKRSLAVSKINTQLAQFWSNRTLEHTVCATAVHLAFISVQFGILPYSLQFGLLPWYFAWYSASYFLLFCFAPVHRRVYVTVYFLDLLILGCPRCSRSAVQIQCHPRRRWESARRASPESIAEHSRIAKWERITRCLRVWSSGPRYTHRALNFSAHRLRARYMYHLAIGPNLASARSARIRTSTSERIPRIVRFCFKAITTCTCISEASKQQNTK